MNASEIEFAEQEIRRYLAQRPDAADTLEGIHRFWVRSSDASESVHITSAALSRMEEQGFIEKRTVGGRTLWRRRSQ